ncbi:iron-containing alcohol dehydrogenase family protein [Acetanaerobacterium elongatum]|uniref:Alcohol dehydrogenase n=1 Tax=Acetanaerobacterium elongatum TaxID=258515 RepID=A0A1H0EFK5_9FIRM|nr:iron-containing alcohol dehydrogenase family protein [Acetanaerobacterium elongatum]SDN81205.1 alcohol dehydrogenase [Acetanaerobacterium elongatum]
MQEQFKFHMPTEILFENGLTQKMGRYIKGSSVLIISDPFLYKNGTAQRIGDTLAGKTVTYFSDIEPNPSCESVDAATAVARESKADCVIGLGGGSSLDVSKIVSCLVTNPGSIYDYYSGGTRVLESRTTQLVCIPTTAGTGSEVTNVGVFTNRKTHIKMPMVNNQFWPDIAMIDPQLTYTLPSAVTASTGMDAFCHAIEAYWNKNALPMCDMLSMGALKLIIDNIKTAYDTPSNCEARSAMIVASLVAGISFSQTRTTGIHALSFPLTTEFGASHGTACSITLPAFIRVSSQYEAQKMNSLVHYLGYESVEQFADAVEALMRSMNMPVRLHELGVQEKDIPHIAEVGLSAAIIQLTPADMNQKTVEALLRSIL